MMKNSDEIRHFIHQFFSSLKAPQKLLYDLPLKSNWIKRIITDSHSALWKEI